MSSSPISVRSATRDPSAERRPTHASAPFGRTNETSLTALPGVCAPSPRGAVLEVPPQRLLLLDRLEECLEVALSEALRALSLDDLVEDRRPVFDRLREDLQQVAI